jgi:hypothetical protein
LGRARCAVVRVDEAALGRNGAHLLIRRNGGWLLTTNGQRWFDVLMY